VPLTTGTIKAAIFVRATQLHGFFIFFNTFVYIFEIRNINKIIHLT